MRKKRPTKAEREQAARETAAQNEKIRLEHEEAERQVKARADEEARKEEERIESVRKAGDEQAAEARRKADERTAELKAKGEMLEAELLAITKTAQETDLLRELAMVDLAYYKSEHHHAHAKMLTEKIHALRMAFELRSAELEIVKAEQKSRYNWILGIAPLVMASMAVWAYALYTKKGVKTGEVAK